MAAPLTHTPPFQVMQYTTRDEDGNEGGGGGGTGAGMLGQDANYAGMSVCPSLIGSWLEGGGRGAASAGYGSSTQREKGTWGRLLLNLGYVSLALPSNTSFPSLPPSLPPLLSSTTHTQPQSIASGNACT